MKKDKKTPENNLDANYGSAVKDYQQEEDKDVKEKHKITKVIIAIILFIAIIFLFLLIRHIKNESAEHFYDPNAKHDDSAIAVATATKGKIEVDGCLLDLTKETVIVTIPLEYYEDEQPADTLTDVEKASGYVSVKKTAENIIYTIKTAYYPSIIENMYKAYSDSYDDDTFLKENHILGLEQYEYMERFTVTIEGDKAFSAPDYYKLLEHTYYKAAIYQSYLGIKPADINVLFQLKNHGAQFTFVEYNFPEMKGKNLSSVAVDTREGTAPNSHVSRADAIEASK